MTAAVETLSREQLAGDFRQAIDILREQGLTQGQFRGKCGGRCATGALIQAFLGHEPDRFSDSIYRISPHVDVLVEVLGEENLSSYERRNFGKIVDWNDRPERTVEDVIAAFERAAERLEAEL